MGALERAFQAGGDFYLCPLGLVRLPVAKLAGYLAPMPGEQETVSRETRMAAESCCGRLGGDAAIDASWPSPCSGPNAGWSCVPRFGRKPPRQLQANLAAAQAELEALTARKRGKKILSELSELQLAAQTILERYQVGGLLRVTYRERCTCAWCGRRGIGRLPYARIPV